MADIAEAARCLADARRLVVFTGAGLSADSGITTFRDAQVGLWSRFDPQALATPEGFEADPPLVGAWYESRRRQVMQAQPHAGHRAVAQQVRQRPGWRVVTQNVDDLHARAAAADLASAPAHAGPAPPAVLHLHGSLFAAHGHRCGRPHPLPAGLPAVPADGQRLAPPCCAACGGAVRPGVVWFGEALLRPTWAEAEAGVRACDAMRVVGTSETGAPRAIPGRAEPGPPARPGRWWHASGSSPSRRATPGRWAVPARAAGGACGCWTPSLPTRGAGRLWPRVARYHPAVTPADERRQNPSEAHCTWVPDKTTLPARAPGRRTGAWAWA